MDRNVTALEGSATENTKTLENVSEKKTIWQRLAPAGLLSPAVLLMISIFAISMGMLFVNSAYHFTGLKIERVITFEAWPKFFSDPFIIKEI